MHVEVKFCSQKLSLRCCHFSLTLAHVCRKESLMMKGTDNVGSGQIEGNVHTVTYFGYVCPCAFIKSKYKRPMGLQQVGLYWIFITWLLFSYECLNGIPVATESLLCGICISPSLLKYFRIYHHPFTPCFF